MPQPDILGRNGTYVGFRKYQSRVGAFNRFSHAHGKQRSRTGTARGETGGRWRSGAPLSLAPMSYDPALGADPATEQ
jgi:deferrochelatase/peroxidase EfeB